MKIFILTLVFCLLETTLTAQRKVKVYVDERVELITITQLLFDYPLVGKAEIGYKKDVLDYFSKYKNERCIENLQHITENNFSFVKPFNYTYHFTFPGFKQMASFNDYEETVLGFKGRHDTLSEFNRNLKRFYKISKFHPFFESKKQFYDSITTLVENEVNKYDLIQEIENYYGSRQNSYNLVLSPLFIDAGMSTWVESANGNNLYSIIGPNTDSKISPDFDIRWLIQNLVLHEFSHPFCNPLIEKHYSQLEKDSCLYEPVRKALLKQGTNGWKSTLCEMFTRANEVLLIRKLYGKEDAEKIYNEYIKQKWIYIQGLVPLLEEYQKNRPAYVSLEDIMPKVIAYFNSEAESQCK